MASYPPPPPPPTGFGPPPQGFGPPPGQGYGPTRSTHGKAIAARICGIAGFVVCPLTAIAAVILGPQAKREIAAEPHRYEGEGLAKAGQIIGWVCLGFWLLLGLAFVVIFVVAASTTSTSDFDSLASLAT